MTEMKNERNGQIFYDPSNNRWKYSRSLMILVLLILIFVFGFFVVSLLRTTALPNLKISPPLTEFFEKNKKRASRLAHFFFSPKVAHAAPSNSLATPKTKTKFLAYLVNWDPTSFKSFQANIGLIDQLVPEWYHLAGADGTIMVNDESKQKEVLETIKEVKSNLPVTPLINNFNSDKQMWDEELIAKLLADPNARTKTISNIKDLVLENNFNGINIDFENIPESSKADLELFMSQLYDVFHPLGLEVSQSIPIKSDGYNIENLSKHNDLIILMAYDQHTAYATSQGPVASLNWFTEVLTEKISNVPHDKIIIALGNYGYNWTENTIPGTQSTFHETMLLAQKHAAEINFHSEDRNPFFEYTDHENKKHQVWFLDAVTAFNQIAVSSRQQVHGFALWRLGSEDPTIWSVVKDRDNLTSRTAKAVAMIPSSEEITYQGHGEVLKVDRLQQIGKRKLEFDSGAGLITKESFTQFPLPYVISRWGGSSDKVVTLTFDDGPDNNYTPKILDTLKKYNVKATFFVTGANATKNPDVLKRIVDEGHTIGSHTFTHADISEISLRQLHLELNSVQRILESTVNRHTILFRPPYGANIEPDKPEEMDSLIQVGKLGYYTVTMHIDPKDYLLKDASDIANKTLDLALSGQGKVIMLHDGGGDVSYTVDALPIIIQRLKGEGFRFVPMHQLLSVSEKDLMPVPANAADLVRSKINNIAIIFAGWSTSSIAFLFITGILAGLARSIYIGTLSFLQWKKTKKYPLEDFDDQHAPYVSVIIPAYNEEKVIVKTIHSLLANTYPNFDILVVDDGSSDNTIELVDREFYYNYPQVRAYKKENGGKPAALNYGIARTTAEIVITLDADTIFLPDAISKLVRHFCDDQVGAVAGNAKVGNRTNAMTQVQALEYFVSQNLDRRAYQMMNCITVVPGAIGAWRKEAILAAGGFSDATLAEDADLTFSILKNNYKIEYADQAIALTEAPDTVRSFAKQRFRWMYGTFQTVWKHKNIFLRPKGKALGLFAMPNVVVFQIFFPLISPIIDLLAISAIVWSVFQATTNPLSYSSESLSKIMLYFGLFVLFELALAMSAFIYEPKEKKKLIIWVILQRFFYRQIMYFVAVKTILAVMKGALVGWNKLERTATVQVDTPQPSAQENWPVPVQS